VTVDGTGVTAVWIRTAAFNDQSILAARVDASGAAVWAPAQRDVATAPSGKSRLAVELGPSSTILAWSDNRSGADDVYVQAVNLDGSLGATPPGPGEVTSLLLDKSPGPLQLRLTWGASCSTGAEDYAVYEGTLASLAVGVYDHAPILCSDAPPLLEETVARAPTDAYYVVVPLGRDAEGSYGKRHDGAAAFERPVGRLPCRPQQTLGCP